MILAPHSFRQSHFPYWDHASLLVSHILFPLYPIPLKIMLKILRASREQRRFRAVPLFIAESKTHRFVYVYPSPHQAFEIIPRALPEHIVKGMSHLLQESP